MFPDPAWLDAGRPRPDSTTTNPTKSNNPLSIIIRSLFETATS